MKKKEKTSFAHLSKDELIKERAALVEKYNGIRLGRYTKQLKNSREIRQIRKKIAVISTYIRQKELIV